MPETKLTPDDVVQLKRIHAGDRNTVMAADVERWRAAGWLEPEPSWKLTRLGLAAICWDGAQRTPRQIREDVEEGLSHDPGPDHRPPPAVRPRTAEEAQPARDSLRRLSDALLRHEHPALRADGRLAWLHSVMPLSTPEEVADALSFAARVFSRVVEDREAFRGVTVPEEQLVRQAVLGALSVLGFLADDMRSDLGAEGRGLTDRRRSVDPPDDGLTQLEREWDAVPAEDVERLYVAARHLVAYRFGFGLDGADLASRIQDVKAAAGAVARVREGVSSRA